MSIKSLMSAAHAAGYAMAADDMGEPTAPIEPERQGTALAVRPAPRPTSHAWMTPKVLRRLWLVDWFAGHWPGRAAA